VRRGPRSRACTRPASRTARLDAGNVALVDGAPLLLDLSAATLGAPRSALDIDVAELLVASTVRVGPDALHAAIAGIGADALAGAVPYLQRAALTPHVRDLARTHEVALDDLREAAAAATGKAPKHVELRRIRVEDLVTVALVIVAASVLIGQIADIGLDTIVDQLGQADLAWAGLALILAQLAFATAGISLRGSVMTPLPLLPCVVPQPAIRFIKLTVPSSAGRIAMNVRFLQRMGASTPEAVAAGAVDDVSEKVVKALLVAATLPLVNVGIDTSRFTGSAPDTRPLLAILIAAVVGVAVVVAVPSLRAKAVPKIRTAFATLWHVARTRRKRLELFGGNIVTELLFALVLGAACPAYGVDLSLAELVCVNTAAGFVSGLIPSPAASAQQRRPSRQDSSPSASTSPPLSRSRSPNACAPSICRRIWGYPSLRWLQRGGYV
jgi:hypothetical protein